MAYGLVWSTSNISVISLSVMFCAMTFSFINNSECMSLLVLLTK